MSRPSNNQPSQAATPVFNCCGDRSRKRETSRLPSVAAAGVGTVCRTAESVARAALAIGRGEIMPKSQSEHRQKRGQSDLSQTQQRLSHLECLLRITIVQSP